MPTTTVSTNPQDAVVPFDAVHQLTYHFQDYVGSTAYLNIRSFPDPYITAVDALRRQVKNRKVGFAPASICLISHGLEVIKANKTVQQWAELRIKFDTIVHLITDETQLGVAEEVAKYLRTFKFHSQLPGMISAGAPWCIRTTEEWRGAISGTAEPLGMNLTSTILMAIVIALSEQPQGVSKTRTRQFKQAADQFFEHIEGRIKFIEPQVRALSGITKS